MRKQKFLSFLLIIFLASSILFQTPTVKAETTISDVFVDGFEYDWRDEFTDQNARWDWDANQGTGFSEAPYSVDDYTVSRNGITDASTSGAVSDSAFPLDAIVGYASGETLSFEGRIRFTDYGLDPSVGTRGFGWWEGAGFSRAAWFMCASEESGTSWQGWRVQVVNSAGSFVLNQAITVNTTEWHTYNIHVGPSGVVFKIDGSIVASTATALAASNIEFIMWIDNQYIDNSWVPQGYLDADINQTMYVDYAYYGENGSYDYWDGNGATTWSDASGNPATNATYGSPWFVNNGTNMADADADDDGTLTSDDINLTDADSFGVSFWYMCDDTESGELVLSYYDGAGYDVINNTLVNAITEDVWYYYSATVTDSQYFDATFRLQFTAACGSGEAVFIDDVTVNMTVTTGVAYLAEFSQSITSSYNLPVKSDFKTVFSQSITATWTTLIQSSFNLVPTLGISFSWITDILQVSGAIQYIADLSFVFTTSFNLLTQWNAKIDLTQTLTTVWNLLPQWNAGVTLTQTVTTAWAILTKTAFSISPSFSVSLTFAIDTLHTIFEGTQYFTDLSVSFTTAFLTLTQWTANVNLIQAVTSTWQTLIQSSFNLTATLSIATTWIVDVLQSAAPVAYAVDLALSATLTLAVNAWTGLQQIAELTLIVATAWGIGDIAAGASTLTIEEVLAIGILAFVFAVVALGVVMLRKK